MLGGAVLQRCDKTPPTLREQIYQTKKGILKEDALQLSTAI